MAVFDKTESLKPGIHRPHPDVDDGNGGTLTNTKYLNVCQLVRWTKFLLFGYFSAGEWRSYKAHPLAIPDSFFVRPFRRKAQRRDKRAPRLIVFFKMFITGIKLCLD